MKNFKAFFRWLYVGESKNCGKIEYDIKYIYVAVVWNIASLIFYELYFILPPAMLRMCDEPVPPELNKVSHHCGEEKRRIS